MDLSQLFDIGVKAYGGLPYWLDSGRAFPPLVVVFNITYRCNLRCAMCFQDAQAKRGHNELSTEEILRVIGEIPSQTVLCLSGGEPTYHPDFPRIARQALATHRCNLITNGTNLTGEVIRLLVDGGLLLIGVSFDGVGEVHDRIRRQRGSFEKSLTNLTRLLAYRDARGRRYPLLDIKTVILPENLADLRKILHMAQELRADYLTLSLPALFGIQTNPRMYFDLTDPAFHRVTVRPNRFDTRLLREQIRYILDHRKGVVVRLYPHFRTVDSMIRYVENIEEIQVDRVFSPCLYPWSVASISAQGYVYPCLHYAVGNLREKPFMELWRSARLREFRCELKKRGVFQGCFGCCRLQEKRKSPLCKSRTGPLRGRSGLSREARLQPPSEGPWPVVRGR